MSSAEAWKSPPMGPSGYKGSTHGTFQRILIKYSTKIRFILLDLQHLHPHLRRLQCWKVRKVMSLNPQVSAAFTTHPSACIRLHLTYEPLWRWKCRTNMCRVHDHDPSSLVFTETLPRGDGSQPAQEVPEEQIEQHAVILTGNTGPGRKRWTFLSSSRSYGLHRASSPVEKCAWRWLGNERGTDQRHVECLFQFLFYRS